MTADYQLDLLRYLVQEPEGIEYIQDVDEEVFTLVEHQQALKVLKKYAKLYDSLPSKSVAQQFLEDEIKDTKGISQDVADILRDTVSDLYIAVPEGDKKKLKDTLVVNIQEQHIEKIFSEYAEGLIVPDQLFLRINKVAGLAKFEDDVDDNGSFLIRDRADYYDNDFIAGNPTFLHDLNSMTAAGGFYSPQLIIFMAGPKSYKTGTILKLGVEYTRNGFNVYYADGENGARSIRNRAKQTIMECSLSELFDPELLSEIDDTLYRFGKYMGGDLFIDEWNAYSSTINDVYNRLTYLKEQYNFVPDIIIWDSIDHFLPSGIGDQKRDTRIQIQKTYHEVISLNRKLHCFSIAPSQVNRHAVNKKVFDMTDISEDFGKIMNAHAVFAICATPEELDQGIRRIIPVVQREGVQYNGKNMCIVSVDMERMIVREVDRDLYLENVDDD